jgi:RNA recognition motif-containing protein
VLFPLYLPRRFGPVTEVRIVTDRETNLCKGYAFIGFATKQIAMAALDGEN